MIAYEDDELLLCGTPPAEAFMAIVLAATAAQLVAPGGDWHLNAYLDTDLCAPLMLGPTAPVEGPGGGGAAGCGSPCCAAERWGRLVGIPFDKPKHRNRHDPEGGVGLHCILFGSSCAGRQTGRTDYSSETTGPLKPQSWESLPESRSSIRADSSMLEIISRCSAIGSSSQYCARYSHEPMMLHIGFLRS